MPRNPLREAGVRILTEHADALPPTVNQTELLDKMLSSHVFSDEEREKITRKAAKGRAVMRKAIDYVRDQIVIRKSAEKDGAEAGA
jgi:hypothetical protein